jgi:hypothetical protein
LEGDILDKCIYLYKQDSILSYDSAEHIIPAGLGGIKKLPKGYVSDQANNLFSKIEKKALRYSLLIGNRLRHGPGKRGNQKVQKEKTPAIRLLNEEKTHGSKLGYIFMGSAYIIPQITCAFNCLSGELKIDCFGDDFETDDFSEYFIRFKTKLVEFLLNEKRAFTFIENDGKSNSSFYIGLHKNKWYISSNSPSFKLDNYVNIIINYFIINATNSLGKINDNIIHQMNKSEIGYSQQIDITDMSFFYLFLKIAFNSLAYLLGQEMALSRSFDEIRHDIINCQNIDNYIVPESECKELFEKHVRNLKNNEHNVFIVSKETTLYSYVSLYNEWHSYMVLSNNYQGKTIVAGFVCDWKSKNEYVYPGNFN